MHDSVARDHNSSVFGHRRPTLRLHLLSQGGGYAQALTFPRYSTTSAGGHVKINFRIYAQNGDIEAAEASMSIFADMDSDAQRV